jgi:ADYC domain
MNMLSRPWALASVALVVGGPGCADPDQLSSTESAIVCEPYVCGQNSPEIDHYGFHDLNLSGKPNIAGIRLHAPDGRAQIYKGTSSYDLVIEDSRILGVKKGVVVLSGQDLRGAEIQLYLGLIPDYRIRIDAVRTIAYRVGPADTLETYSLSWYGPKNTPDSKRNICTPPVVAALAATPSSTTLGSTSRSSRPPGDEFGMFSYESLVFEGDRINAATKTMEPLRDNSWFNIACQGHTLAKLHLTRHTMASRAEQLGINHEQRQSTLKMLVADYCGKGDSFTVAGEPLAWQGGLVSFSASLGRFEARWTSKGATCLHEPRLLVTQSPLAQQLFPDIAAAIRNSCDVPLCSNLDPYDSENAAVVSVNPN